MHMAGLLASCNLRILHVRQQIKMQFKMHPSWVWGVPPSLQAAVLYIPSYATALLKVLVLIAHP